MIPTLLIPTFISLDFRRLLPRIGLFALILSLTGCFGLPYRLDYQPDFPFNALQTYQLAIPPGKGESLNDQRVRRLIDPIMAARGYRIAGGQAPDFLVNWRFESVVETDTSGFSFGVGYGMGVGPRTTVGTSLATRPPTREVHRDRLALEVLTPAGDRVVWRAEAREPLDAKASPGERDREIREMLEQMIQSFPPKEDD